MAAGEPRRVEGKIAQQVERVGVRLPACAAHLLEIIPALVKLLDDVSSLASVRPTGARPKARPGWAKCSHFLGGIVGWSLTTRSCLPSESIHGRFGDDFDLAASK